MYAYACVSLLCARLGVWRAGLTATIAVFAIPRSEHGLSHHDPHGQRGVLVVALLWLLLVRKDI